MRPTFLATRSSRTVALVFALNGFVFANWFARIPTVKGSLQLSDGALGIALLGTPIGALLIMAVTGWLVAHFGAARVTLVAAAALCLALPGPALAPNALSLLLALALLGLASGAMDIAMNAEAALIEREAGQSIMVGFHAMFSLGGAVGAFTGAVGAATATPLVHLSLAAALGLAALVWRRETLPKDEKPVGDAGPVFALPRGPLLGIAAIAFASMLGEGAAADWSAVYLSDVIGSSPFIAGIGFTAFAVGMTAGRLTGDWLGDRFGDLRLVRVGAGIGGSTLLLALWLEHPAAAVLGFASLGLGLAAIVPVCFRRAAGVRGSSPGHGLAAVATLGYAGFLAGPPAIGLLAELFGLGVRLSLVGVLMLLTALSSGRLLAPTPARDSPAVSP